MDRPAPPARIAERIAGLARFGDDVRRITLHRVSLPLRRPLVSAHGTEARRESTLVAVELLDGTVGWGECVALARPTYTSEHADGAYAALRDEIVPRWSAGTPIDADLPMAFAALEGAAVDARLRAQGIALVDALGAERRSVPTAGVVGRTTSVDELVEQVAALVERRAAGVSLKIEPGWDVEPLEAVRRTWPELDLAADANGAYRPSDLDRFAALAPLGLHHLEQPLAPSDLAALRDVRAVLDAPIALDESVPSTDALDVVVEIGGADAVNLKPARVGGLAAALRLVDRASEAGLALYVGGMLETGVGRAQAVALAARAELTWPTHLGPSEQYFARDLTEPVVVDEHGDLVVPDGAGSGVAPSPDALAAVETDRAVVTVAESS